MNWKFFGILYGFEDRMPAYLIEEANQKMQELRDDAKQKFDEWLEEKGLENVMGIVQFDKTIKKWDLTFKDKTEKLMSLHPGDVFRSTNAWGDVYEYTYLGWGRCYEPGFDWVLKDNADNRIMNIEPEWLHQRKIEIIGEEEGK